MTPTCRYRRWGDRGSAGLELAVGTFGWVAGLLMLASVYQIVTSHDDVAAAAGQAARAASLSAGPTEAITAAHRFAEQRLTVGSCQTSTVQVAVDISDFTAGGTVAVTVSCRTHPPLGATIRVSSTADEVLDRYRGGL